MEFDTKERYKFFCCARQRACAIGSGPRKGHSALRPCTAHASRADLVSKKRSASDPACEDCETARLSLSRRGLHPRWRCEALEDRQYCLIKWPGRIYSGLFAFDAMHVLFINCIDYFLDILLDSMTATMKATLDKRVLALTPFRNPADGRTTRRVRKLSSTGYLSAEMKVVYLFVLPHALGSKALLLPSNLRKDTLVAMSCLQIICYSVRGSRPFTRSEHHYIFNNIGTLFFRSLTKLEHTKKLKRIAAAERYNVDKPPAKRRRVPYWQPAVQDSDESSDTESSSDVDMPPFYLRSDKIIPHAFVHFPEQVFMGGTHKFHDTCAQESTHRRCLRTAGARARTYHDLNHSSSTMLNFMNDIRLLEEICAQAKIDDDPGTGTHHMHPQYILCSSQHMHTTYSMLPTTYTHNIYNAPTTYTHNILVCPQHIVCYPPHALTIYTCSSQHIHITQRCRLR